MNSEFRDIEAMTRTTSGHVGSNETRSDQLVEALLVSNSLHDASKKAGIPYSSARRLWYDSDFQAEYAKARQEVFEVTIGRVKGLASMALDVIEGAVSRGDQGAARWLLDKAMGLHDEDVEARLRALEEKGNGLGRTTPTT